MYSEGIYVLDKAYGYHLTGSIPYNLKLEFLPTKYRFLYKDLSYK